MLVSLVKSLLMHKRIQHCLVSDLREHDLQCCSDQRQEAGGRETSQEMLVTVQVREDVQGRLRSE